MKKKIVAIDDCKDGDILAEDIVNRHGTTLVSKNSVLNSYVLDRLRLWSIQQVRIYELPAHSKKGNKAESMEEKYRYNIRQVKDIICSMVEGQKLDEEKLNFLSDSLLKDINEAHNVIYLLDKMREADEYTYTHSMNVALYSMLIGKWMKMDPSDIRILIMAGLLHDVGKIQIPLRILNKAGRLLPKELEIMKQHPVHGYNMLKDLAFLQSDIPVAVLHHHERVDGSGYPSKLKGHEISPFSKIIAVADVYDAVTSDRIYKKRATPFEAFRIFNNECMENFDVSIVNVFLKNLASFYTGSKVILSTGNVGEVAFVPPHNICNPIIRIENTFLDLSKEKDLEIAYFGNLRA